MGPSVLLIYVTVCVGNIQKLMRERNVPREFIATAVLPREWVVPMSRSAIAAATGLPRETVRRHVGQLIEHGLLIEDPRGGVTIVPGAIQDRGYEPLLEKLLTEFARTTEALLRAGVIEVDAERYSSSFGASLASFARILSANSARNGGRSTIAIDVVLAHVELARDALAHRRDGEMEHVAVPAMLDHRAAGNPSRRACRSRPRPAAAPRRGRACAGCRR